MYIQVWILQTIWFLKSFFFILDILLLKYVAQLLKQINLKVFHLINKDFCQVWYNWPPSSRVEDENNKNNDDRQGTNFDQKVKLIRWAKNHKLWITTWVWWENIKWCNTLFDICSRLPLDFPIWSGPYLKQYAESWHTYLLDWSSCSAFTKDRISLMLNLQDDCHLQWLKKGLDRVTI